MKRKYFFGILLSLFLLCGGVFLLTADSEYIDFNNQLDDVAHATDINIHIGEVYGYDTLGANITIQYGVSNSSGTFAQTLEHKVFTDTAKNKKTLGTSVSSKRGYDHRKIKFTNFSVASGLYAIDSKLDCVADATDNKYDDEWDGASIGPGVRLFTWNVEVENRYTGISWNFTIYWTVNLTLYANDGTSDYTTIRYSTYDKALTSSLTIPTRSGYTFQGYYTGENGKGQQWIQADGDPNATYLNRNTARPKKLYAHWTPKTYQIDTNILSPNDEQDYKSGTMIQSYNGQPSKVTTDQVYSSIKADTTLTIKDINPATGMYVSSITVDRGTISVTKSDGIITGCTYTVSPSVLGNPRGNGNWDAIISINMDYKDYDVTIKDGDEAVSNLADMTWISGATFNGTSYTYNANGITSTYNTATGDFKINGTPTNSFTILTCLGLTLKQNEQYKLEVTPKEGNMLEYNQNGLFVFEVCDENGNNLSSRQYNNLKEIPTTAYNATFSSTLKISANSATNGEGLKLWYWVAGTPASQMFTNYTINIKITKVGSKQNVNKKVKATYNLSMRPVPVPSRPGYSFEGYYYGDTQYYSKSGSSVRNWDKDSTATLNAKWKAYVFTYSFDTDGGSTHAGGTAAYGSSITLPKPSRKGYTFKGWQHSINGNTYQAGSYSVNDTANGDATVKFTAIWQANDYKINYNLAGGSHGSSHPTTAIYRDKYDEDSGKNDNIINISNPTKVGYTFTGWTASGLSNTAKSGVSNSLSELKTWNGSATKNTYFANLTEIANRTVTLTANWTANTYTINYNLGDDDTYPANLGSNAPKSATYNAVIEIPTPTRVGYVFVGWTLSGDSISTAQSGASTTSLSAWDGGANRNRYFKNLTPDASGSVTMTATWQETIASSPSITATKPAKDSNNEYYLISNIDNLAWLALQGDMANVTGMFRQTNNITIPDNILWLPIGRLGSFSGTYDGQGNTIRGLTTYNGTDANGNYLETNGGLFANASDATIRNVIIEDATIYGQNAGIIAGSASTNNTGSSTNISNCVVSGTVKGTSIGSIIGNSNGASISVCLAKGVNTASFAGGSASIDSCIYELTGGTRGASDSFNNYSAWIYPSNFAYPMPKAFMWYPYPELSEDSLNTWLNR